MKRILATVSILAFFSFAALAQQTRQAVVNLSSCCIRNAPDYESGLDTQARMGDIVQVLDNEGVWYKVETPDPYVGWTAELSLAFMSEEEVEAYRNAPKWICVAEYTHIFAKPDGDAPRICDFVMGDVVRKTASKARGWVCVTLPDGKNGWVRKSDVEDLEKWTATRVCTAENIISLAMEFVGVPYLWGGISPKYFDCSGLTKFCFMMNGGWLPRDCSQQIKQGTAVALDVQAMEPGDLLFFGNPETGRPAHVGIYIGNGRMIHASQLVRINSIVEGEPDYYASKQLIAVRRVL